MYSDRPRFQPTTTRPMTMLAHLFAVIATILLLVWLLRFRGGINLESDDSDLVFNAHPFLMVFGFIFMAGEAIMAYRMIPAEQNVQKFVHMALHLVAITLGIVGIYAVFKFHRMSEIDNMFSLHSWLGMITFCLYGLQWLFGFLIFWFPRASDVSRHRIRPWHMFFGRVLLYLAIVTAETGLMEKATLTQLEVGSESRLMNFTGLFILLFGLAKWPNLIQTILVSIYTTFSLYKPARLDDSLSSSSLSLGLSSSTRSIMAGTGIHPQQLQHSRIQT
ncbi:hypothetical protein Syun_022520 [Stephania yunnanensis]|uniref:Cytochrome b561 domain-containing protein n=1 Tax=Stephania yunnanensis TaxID=152371 RepID=A0AAP0FKU7_9MAGN